MIQPVKEKIILGIDPGTTIMGYGVLRVKGTKPEMIAMGIIDLRKFANHYLKLRHIHERVLSIIESYRSSFFRQERTVHVEVGTCSGSGDGSGIEP